MQPRLASPPDAASTSSSTLVSQARSYKSLSSLGLQEEGYLATTARQRSVPLSHAESSRRSRAACPPDHRCDEDGVGLGLCACAASSDSPATPDSASEAEQSGVLTPRARDSPGRRRSSLREARTGQSSREQRVRRQGARSAGEGASSSYRGLAVLEEQARERTTSPRRSLGSRRSPRPRSHSSASSSYESPTTAERSSLRQLASSPSRISPRMTSTARTAASSPTRSHARQGLSEPSSTITSAERARLAGVYAKIEAENERARLASRARSEERRKRLGMGPPPWVSGADLVDWHPQPRASQESLRADSDQLTEDALAMLAAVPDIVASEPTPAAPTTLINASPAALRLSRDGPEENFPRSHQPPSPRLLSQRRLTQITSPPRAASYAERISALRGAPASAASSARRISLRRSQLDGLESGRSEVGQDVSGHASRLGFTGALHQSAQARSDVETSSLHSPDAHSAIGLPPSYLEDAQREADEESTDEHMHAQDEMPDEDAPSPLVSPVRVNAVPHRTGNQLGAATSVTSDSFVFPAPSSVRVGIVQTDTGSPNVIAGPSRLPAQTVPLKSPLLAVTDYSTSFDSGGSPGSAPASPRRHRRGGTPTLSISARAPGSEAQLRDALNTALDVPTEEASWMQNHWARSPPVLQFQTSVVDSLQEQSELADSSRRSVRFSPQPPSVRFIPARDSKNLERNENGQAEKTQAPLEAAQVQAPTVDLTPAARAAEMSGFMPRPPGAYASPARPLATRPSLPAAPEEGISRFYFPPRRSPSKSPAPSTPRRISSPPLSRTAQKAAAAMSAAASSSLATTPRAPGAFNISGTNVAGTSLSLSASSTSGHLASLAEDETEEVEEEEEMVPSSLRELSRSRSASATPAPRASTPPRMRDPIPLPSVADQSADTSMPSMDEFRAMPMVQRVQVVLEAMQAERKAFEMLQEPQPTAPVTADAAARASKEAVSQAQVQAEERNMAHATDSVLRLRLSHIRAKLGYFASAFRSLRSQAAPASQINAQPHNMWTFYIVALALQLFVVWVLLLAADAGSDWYFRTTYYDPFYPMLYPDAPLVLFGEVPPRFSLHGARRSWLPSLAPRVRLILDKLRNNWEPFTSLPIVQTALLAASQFLASTFYADESDYIIYFPT